VARLAAAVVFLLLSAPLAAKTLGLTIPPSLLLRADKLIE